MKKLFPTCLLAISISFSLFSQSADISMKYEPSEKQPYGLLNPNAPEEVADFAPIIGTCDCRSLPRNGDGTWPDTLDMVWRFKYVMNGTAVQDEVWRANDQYAGSMRQYQPDSAHWVVTYFSYPAVSSTPGVWHGGKVGDDIILKMPQKAPNGMEGKYRITFYEMSEAGFRWKGEWMDTAETFSYPTWYIDCKKRKE